MVTGVIITAAFWFIVAAVTACIEIEAEGKFGWAEKMPTWYRKTGLIAKLYGMAMNGKPLTGYHLFMFVYPLLIFHSAFFMGAAWTLELELWTMSLYFIFCPFWDFLWFVLNPHYGIKRFRRENIWWHGAKKWILGLPQDYYVGIAISAILAFFAHGLTAWGISFGVFITGTLIALMAASLYHSWYNKMRTRDDR